MAKDFFDFYKGNDWYSRYLEDQESAATSASTPAKKPVLSAKPTPTPTPSLTPPAPTPTPNVPQGTNGTYLPGATNYGSGLMTGSANPYNVDATTRNLMQGGTGSVGNWAVAQAFGINNNISQPETVTPRPSGAFGLFTATQPGRGALDIVPQGVPLMSTGGVTNPNTGKTDRFFINQPTERQVASLPASSQDRFKKGDIFY